eukprot:TRINITY_DN77358_c0_g1_i1.p1 TRINITY_DN77358_c0_g1~~TRINITY_DN77358_c0_g1_i1.p1  ORF type:complete len:498 (+),score=111.99 TRINITY_DN77358_c0_g1_i1:21-1514(+)
MLQHASMWSQAAAFTSVSQRLSVAKRSFLACPLTKQTQIQRSSQIPLAASLAFGMQGMRRKATAAKAQPVEIQARSHATLEHSVEPATGLFRTTIPSGRKALVLSPWGTERTVHGPCTVSRFGSNISMFRHYVVPAGDKVVVWDEHGEESSCEGPAAINVHPDASLHICPRIILDADQKVLVIDKDGCEQVLNGPCVFHAGPRDAIREYRLVRLASNEAVCVVRQDGVRETVLGSDQPRLFLDPREKLHKFVLTGGGDADGLGKQPGALTFEVLRLQPSQAYFAFPVRTADNAVLILKLMVFMEIKRPDLFILRDDPFAVMFNFIMAEATELVGFYSFDDFKQQPGRRLREHFESSAKAGEPVLQFFADQYGLDVSKIVLRGWMAQDPQVQKILDQAAAAQTQRDVARAEHALALEKLENEREQLESAAKHYDLKAQAAEAKGRQEGLRIASMYKAVEAGLDGASNEPSTVAELVRTHEAGHAVGSGGGKLTLRSNL